MKLSTSLLQSIALGIALTTASATMTSCEKDAKVEKLKNDRTKPGKCDPPTTDPCPMCGMG